MARTLYDITEVAKETGIAASALRYYEGKGLIRSIGRHGLRRLFDKSIFDRLAFITLGRAAGFSLQDIAAMTQVSGRPQIDRQALSDKADEINTAIKRLTAMRNGLRHAAKCKETDHFECPTFRRLLRLSHHHLFHPATNSTLHPKNSTRNKRRLGKKLLLP